MIDGLTAAEGALLLWIQQEIRTPFLTPLMQGLSRLGDFGLLWILLTAGLLLFKRTRAAGAASACALLASVLLNNVILKNLIARPRPYEMFPALQLITVKPGDFSFPSGHTAASFASAVSQVCWCRGADVPESWRRTAAFLLVPAFLIGLSRIYVGAHYPTDVLGGLLTGALCGVIGWKISGVPADIMTR